jgi:hypothetical protein
MISNPRFNARVDLSRASGNYSDLLALVRRHYDMYASAEQIIGPYNAKQRQRQVYTPPSRELLRELVKQCGVNDLTYHAFLSSLVRFCETTKGNMALPLAHPSTIHSLQLPEDAFFIDSCQLHVVGEPLDLRLNGRALGFVPKFAIVRPCMAQRGMTSATKWEALFFDQRHGYLPAWADSNVNSRWAGSLT